MTEFVYICKNIAIKSTLTWYYTSIIFINFLTKTDIPSVQALMVEEILK